MPAYDALTQPISFQLIVKQKQVSIEFSCSPEVIDVLRSVTSPADWIYHWFVIRNFGENQTVSDVKDKLEEITGIQKCRFRIERSETRTVLPDDTKVEDIPTVSLAS